MASNKLFVLLLICAAMAVSIEAASKPVVNNVLAGSRANGDKILKFATVMIPSKLLSVINKKETYSVGGTISQVKLRDQNKKGNGAKARIINGGPGTRSVTVEFTSQRGHSIDFIVEIYGK